MNRPKTALFVTCLIDSFRPQIGFATARLLEKADCEVFVPPQTCCGQPAYNEGSEKISIALARNVIRAFSDFDYVVTPSASCAGMIKNHYTKLFAKDTEWSLRAQALSEKTHELFSFLVNVRGQTSIAAKCERKAVCHVSCSSLREVKCAREVRTLLGGVEGLDIVDVPDTEVCCGFGGLFSVKYHEISARMADDKITNAVNIGADLLIGQDLGCLLHLAGRISRKGTTIELCHAAEVLAGMVDEAALGGDRS